jgi:hypothetical protein
VSGRSDDHNQHGCKEKLEASRTRTEMFSHGHSVTHSLSISSSAGETLFQSGAIKT